MDFIPKTSSILIQIPVGLPSAHKKSKKLSTIAILLIAVGSNLVAMLLLLHYALHLVFSITISFKNQALYLISLYHNHHKPIFNKPMLLFLFY
jgi:hypothetical protein